MPGCWRNAFAVMSVMPVMSKQALGCEYTPALWTSAFFTPVFFAGIWCAKCDRDHVDRVLGCRKRSFHAKTVTDLCHAFEVEVESGLCKQPGVESGKPVSGICKMLWAINGRLHNGGFMTASCVP